MVDKGERIFLLEVFVDNVHLESCKQDNKPVKTCVRFRFLNYPFLEIMEDEYCRIPDNECNVKFQSGKSCLFSLRKNPAGCKKPPLNLNVNVVQMESETKSTDVGKTMINLSGSFTNLIETVNLKPDNCTPVSRIIRETYVLSNDKNQTVGNITIFVRLSCFGKIIVTQFQMSGLESKSFLFKAVSDIRGKRFEGSGDAGMVFDSSLPQCPSRQLSEHLADKSLYSNRASQPMVVAGSPPRTMSVVAPPGIMGPGAMAPGMMGPGMMGPGMMGPGMMGPGMMGPGMMGPGFGQPGVGYPGLMTTGTPGQGVPGIQEGGMHSPGAASSSPMSIKPFGELGLSAKEGGLDYKNFSATVNGHVLNIKVLRKPRKLKQTQAVFLQNLPCDKSSSSDESEEEKTHKSKKCPPCPPCPEPCPPTKVPLCDCDIPTPPCLVCPPPPPPPPPKKKKKKKSTCPKDAGMFCRPGCPLGFPTPPGLIPPSYSQPAPLGASQAATGEQQNFLITMEPRTEFPPIRQPPKPTCFTVRDTQYEDGDFGNGTKKGSKGKGKGKGKAGKGKKK